MKKIIIAITFLLITTAIFFTCLNDETQYNSYKKLEKHNIDASKILLSALYHSGNGQALNEIIYQNYHTSHFIDPETYERAIKTNNDVAMTRLAQIHEKETNEYNKVIELYIQAAKLDNILAMLSLARIYERGEIIQKNPKESFK